MNVRVRANKSVSSVLQTGDKLRSYFFLWNTKLSQQLFGIFKREPPQVSVGPCHCLLNRLWLFVILKIQTGSKISLS